MTKSTVRTPLVPALNRRRFLALGGAAFAALGLAGCGGGGGGGDGSGRLRATWWGDPSLNEAIEQAIGAFSEQDGRPGVSTEALPWDGYWDKLATQTAAQGQPDLMLFAGTYIPEYVSRNVLLGLDDYLGSTIDIDAVDEGVRELGSRDGVTHAVISAVNAQTVVYNAALLAELGIEAPDHTWTWDDLRDIGARVNAADENVFGVQDGGDELISFQVWSRQRGKELLDDDDQLAVTRDELIEWFAFWEELRQAGVAPPRSVTAEGSGDMARSPMVRRQAAMAIVWNQDLMSYGSLMDDQLGLTMLPGTAGGQPGQWLNAANLWAGSAHTDDADNVAELIDFLVNDDTAIDAIGVRLGVPPTEYARDRVREGISDIEAQVIDYIELVGENSTPLPRLWPQGFTTLRTLLPRLNEEVAFGDQTVESAADTFFSEAETALG